MALQKFTDAAGREAWLDPQTQKVYTNGGKTDTFYKLNEWNKRQEAKYGAGSNDPVSSYVDSLLKSVSDPIKEQTDFLKSYSKKNPFAFDEVLAKSASEAEYVPYYTELLQDYTDTLNLKRQSIQDDRKLLDELKSYEMGKASREYQQAVSQAEEGFADSGMFFSGIKKKALGGLAVEDQASDQYRQAGFDYKEGALGRESSGLDIESAAKTRDIGRDQLAAVTGGIEQRRQEATQNYNNILQQSYLRKFGGSSNDLLAGYTVPSYLKYATS